MKCEDGKYCKPLTERLLDWSSTVPGFYRVQSLDHGSDSLIISPTRD